MTSKLLLALILVLNTSLSLAQDDYYDEQPPMDDNYDAYDSPEKPQVLHDQAQKLLPVDAYESDAYPPVEKEIEPYQDNVDPYPQEDPYPENYDDSY